MPKKPCALFVGCEVTDHLPDNSRGEGRSRDSYGKSEAVPGGDQDNQRGENARDGSRFRARFASARVKREGVEFLAPALLFERRHRGRLGAS